MTKKMIAVLAVVTLAGCYTATAPSGKKYTCIPDQRTDYPPFPGEQLTVVEAPEEVK